jgi:hypothetical protein
LDEVAKYAGKNDRSRRAPALSGQVERGLFISWSLWVQDSEVPVVDASADQSGLLDRVLVDAVQELWFILVRVV